MALTFQQADAIIEQLTTRIHGLIGTDYRDAAIDAASRAKSSETNAKSSETKAKASEEASKSSETNAKSSETKAKASEEESTSQAELSTEAAAISALSAIAFDQLVGEGSPEGKVEAPVGATYTDRLATNGVIRWIKTSGTGNTGWQVEPSADTITTLATWTADAGGVRNHFSYTYLSNLENWHSSTYYILKEVIQLEPNAEYTFHAEEVTADTKGEWTVLNLMDGTDGIVPYSSSNKNRIRTIYNRKEQEEPRYGLSLTFAAPSSGKVYFEFYSNGKRGEDAKPFWITEKLVRAQIVRGREVPEWRPSPEDAVAGLTGNGESTSPFPQHDPAHTIRTDSSVGTRVFVGDTMIHGDTGWRMLSSLVAEDNFLAASIAVRRRGNTVEVVGYNILAHEDSSSLKTLLTLPKGFLPSHTARYGTSYWGKRWNITSMGALNIGQSMGSDYFNLMYTTHDFWPTSLPGTPA